MPIDRRSAIHRTGHLPPAVSALSRLASAPPTLPSPGCPCARPAGSTGASPPAYSSAMICSARTSSVRARLPLMLRSPSKSANMRMHGMDAEPVADETYRGARVTNEPYQGLPSTLTPALQKNRAEESLPWPGPARWSSGGTGSSTYGEVFL